MLGVHTVIEEGNEISSSNTVHRHRNQEEVGMMEPVITPHETHPGGNILYQCKKKNSLKKTSLVKHLQNPKEMEDLWFRRWLVSTSVENTDSDKTEKDNLKEDNIKSFELGQCLQKRFVLHWCFEVALLFKRELGSFIHLSEVRNTVLISISDGIIQLMRWLYIDWELKFDSEYTIHTLLFNLDNVFVPFCPQCSDRNMVTSSIELLESTSQWFNPSFLLWLLDTSKQGLRNVELQQSVIKLPVHCSAGHLMIGASILCFGIFRLILDIWGELWHRATKHLEALKTLSGTNLTEILKTTDRAIKLSHAVKLLKEAQHLFFSALFPADIKKTINLASELLQSLLPQIRLPMVRTKVVADVSQCVESNQGESSIPINDLHCGKATTTASLGRSIHSPCIRFQRKSQEWIAEWIFNNKKGALQFSINDFTFKKAKRLASIACNHVTTTSSCPTKEEIIKIHDAIHSDQVKENEAYSSNSEKNGSSKQKASSDAVPRLVLTSISLPERHSSIYYYGKEKARKANSDVANSAMVNLSEVTRFRSANIKKPANSLRHSKETSARSDELEYSEPSEASRSIDLKKSTSNLVEESGDKPITPSSCLDGIFYIKKRAAWVCQWNSNGKQLSRYFSVKTHGFQLAKELAIEYRLKKFKFRERCNTARSLCSLSLYSHSTKKEQIRTRRKRKSEEQTYDSSLPSCKGVHFAKASNSWCCTWRVNGRRHRKHFSVSRYGYERARELALELKKENEQKKRIQKKFNCPDDSELLSAEEWSEEEQANEEQYQKDGHLSNLVDDSDRIENGISSQQGVGRKSSVKQRKVSSENTDLVDSNTKEDIVDDCDEASFDQLFRSGVKGVTYNRFKQNWNASWRSNHDTTESMSFSVKEFGFEGAKELAIAAREEGVKTGKSTSKDYREALIVAYKLLQPEVIVRVGENKEYEVDQNKIPQNEKGITDVRIPRRQQQTKNKISNLMSIFTNETSDVQQKKKELDKQTDVMLEIEK